VNYSELLFTVILEGVAAIANTTVMLFMYKPVLPESQDAASFWLSRIAVKKTMHLWLRLRT
jgi:hypothetical protein